MNRESSIDGVSVIICCYNSAMRLPSTLQHLSLQKSSEKMNWEIIVVDNNSTDETAATAEKTWNELGRTDVSLKIIREQNTGLMFARKKGTAEAEYDCIVFCDDDNWLGENYIAFAKKIMESDPGIGIAGGQIFPVTDAEEFPAWFEEYKSYYATGIPAAASGDITARGFVVGAGMITRRNLFFGAFDESYPTILQGRSGKKLSAGEDFEFCKRLLILDYKLYYSADLVMNHFIPSARLTEEYRTRLLEGIAESRMLLTVYDDALYVIKNFRKKNRLRMMILTPIRLLLARAGLSSRNPATEQLKLFYLSPFPMKGSKEQQMIKKFFHHNQNHGKL